MNWQEAIKNALSQFEGIEISDSNANAEYLAMYVLGIWNKSELHKYLSAILSQVQEIKYEEVIARRLNHEPLQHIIGETEFFGLRLFTSPAALIPRPDTEILVEEVLKEISVSSHTPLKILDIGTGSGAIALALAVKLPHALITGIDISPDAVALANKNKERLKLENVSFEVSLYRDEGSEQQET